jgi:hypothetical protein
LTNFNIIYILIGNNNYGAKMNLSQALTNIMSSLMLINIKVTGTVIEQTTGKNLNQELGNLEFPFVGAINTYETITLMIQFLGFFILMSMIYRFISHNPYAGSSFIENNQKDNKLVSLDKTPSMSEVIVDKNEDLFKKPMIEFDFQDIGLNTIVSQILEKVKYLKNHDIVKKDMEIALIIENTRTQYLKQILNTYMNIPKYKRGIVEDKESPIYSAMAQLNTVLDGLNKVEERILKNTLMSQKANEIFLTEKMKNI